MGWLKWSGKYQQAELRTEQAPSTSLDSKSQVEHVEVAPPATPTPRHRYPYQPSTTPDARLPFIEPAVVRASRSDPARIWIVVDNIVYDCTEFVFEHPGGHTVIQSFDGEDCSWQFWRFHHRSNMEKEGKPLRIGCTSGVLNRFKEKPQFLGLRSLGSADDW